MLLLDEPTAALDPDGLCAFYGLVERARDGRPRRCSSPRTSWATSSGSPTASPSSWAAGSWPPDRSASWRTGSPSAASCACGSAARPDGLLAACARVAPAARLGGRRAGRARARRRCARACSTSSAARASRSAGLTAEEGRLDALYRELVAEAPARRPRVTARVRRARARARARGVRVRRPPEPARARHAQRRVRLLPHGGLRRAASPRRSWRPGELPRFFDDLGCLADYLTAGKAPAGAAAFVADHRTKAWVRADRAVYTRVPGLATPMGSHVDRARRRRLARRRPGRARRRAACRRRSVFGPRRSADEP